MDTMDTMGHYRLYVALLQNPIDSPGFADVSKGQGIRIFYHVYTLSLQETCYARPLSTTSNLRIVEEK